MGVRVQVGARRLQEALDVLRRPLHQVGHVRFDLHGRRAQRVRHLGQVALARPAPLGQPLDQADGPEQPCADLLGPRLHVALERLLAQHVPGRGLAPTTADPAEGAGRAGVGVHARDELGKLHLRHVHGDQFAHGMGAGGPLIVDLLRLADRQRHVVVVHDRAVEQVRPGLAARG